MEENSAIAHKVKTYGQENKHSIESCFDTYDKRHTKIQPYNTIFIQYSFRQNIVDYNVW